MLQLLLAPSSCVLRKAHRQKTTKKTATLTTVTDVTVRCLTSRGEAPTLLNNDRDNNGRGDDGDEDDGDSDGDGDDDGDKRNNCPCASTTFGVVDTHTMSLLTCETYNKFQLQVYNDSV